MKHKPVFLLLLGLLASAAASAGTIEMKVNGLVCGFCAQGIDKKMRENPATDTVTVSLENKRVVVTTKSGTDISDADLTKAITEAGYELKGITRSPERTAQR
jgi:copper chaperone CopZ